MKETRITTTIDPAASAKVVNQAAAVGILGNVLLTAFKLIAGIVGHSAAMTSDAVHSLSDVFATLVALIGRKISERPADKEHPYGHERFESLASVILGAILIGTGVKIGYECVQSILNKTYLTAAQPGVIALIAALVSIAVKEGMFWYTLHQANKINSSVFRADAWHHRSDALSSVGALVGILFARFGFPVMDSVAGLVIAVVILIVAIRIIRDAVNNTLDRSAGPKFEEDLRKAIVDFAADTGLSLSIDSIVTRQFGDRIYVDLEIGVDGDLKLKYAHDIAEDVHAFIERDFQDVKHVMVHLNPRGYEYTVRG